MKTLTPRLAAAMLIAAFFPLAATAADSPSVLLQKGIYAEETEGNVDAAIKIYEQIAAEAATSRAVIAQAQYRLAVCYQKKGNKEQAIKLLDELVQQPPSDADMLRKAKSVLMELGAPPNEGMTVRKLPLSIPGWPEAMSQDGRLVAYEPKGGYDLAIFEVATGKTWLIAKCVEDKSPEGVAISPDGKYIAYDLSDSTIYVAKIDGSETRKLFAADDKAEYAWTADWSQDSSRLFVESVWSNSESSTIVAVDIKTGTKQEVARAKRGRQESWSLSFDGRYLARRRGQYPRSISVMDLKSSREETVIAADAGVIVGWVPNTAKLVFSKNHGATSDLLAVEIKDGKPAGESEVLRSNFPTVGATAQPLGIARDGGIYYFVRRDRAEPSELWVMEGFLANSGTAKEGMNIETDIPTSEMAIGTDNSVQDRKFGLSFTLPAGWSIQTAVRRANGGNGFTLVTTSAKRARISFSYRSTTPWAEGPVTSGANAHVWGPKKPEPEEVDAWLRKQADWGLKSLSEQHPDAKLDSDGFTPRVIGGHKALSGSASYKNRDVPWISIGVSIFSDKAHSLITLQGPAAEVDAIRPAFETFVSSFQLP